MNQTRHFLTLADISSDEFKMLIQRGMELKKMQKNGDVFQPFVGKTMAMIFEKSSTRTRLSFEVGMAQLGGHAIFLSPRDTQLGRGEPIEDSAKVISSMADIVMIRTFEHSKLETFAKHSHVPVINGLTDDYHPCQLLADIMTFQEHRGDILGKTVTWIGDGNNMCQSFIMASRLLGFHLNVCTPQGFEPKEELVQEFKESVTLFTDLESAVAGSHLVVTDVWASMGKEDEKDTRVNAFEGFQVSETLLDKASDDVIFMHCLPAYRGEEVSPTLLEDRRSVVFDEAENRLHAQKALIEFLLS